MLFLAIVLTHFKDRLDTFWANQDVLITIQISMASGTALL